MFLTKNAEGGDGQGKDQNGFTATISSFLLFVGKDKDFAEEGRDV